MLDEAPQVANGGFITESQLFRAERVLCLKRGAGNHQATSLR